MRDVIEMEFSERAPEQAALVDHQLNFRTGCILDSLQ